MDQGFQGFLLSSKIFFFQREEYLRLIDDFQRFPPVDDDVMNRIERHTDRDAAVYYHFVGASQCKVASFILFRQH
jgi:hypothetical protein